MTPSSGSTAGWRDAGERQRRLRLAHCFAQELVRQKHGDARYDPGDEKFDKYLKRGLLLVAAMDDHELARDYGDMKRRAGEDL